jgi:hypothetical protein
MGLGTRRRRTGLGCITMCGQNMKKPILNDSVDTPVGVAIRLKEVFIMLRLSTICSKEAPDTMCDQFVDFDIELLESENVDIVIWVECRIDCSTDIG